MGQSAQDQVAGTDGVVVARDDVRRLIGVTVGVDQADHRDAQAVGLAHADGLALEVDDDDCVRQPLHIGDATQVCLELQKLGLGRQTLTRGKQVELTLDLLATKLVQTLDSVGHRDPVGQQSAEPAVVDERHTAPLGLVAHGVLAILLGPDEHHGATAGADVADKVHRLAQKLQRLDQVDDVDAGALPKDVALHLGIPTAGLVSEMHSGLQELLHGDGHGGSSFGCGVEAIRRALRWNHRCDGTDHRTASPG